MEVEISLNFIVLGMVGFALIAILIFYFRKKDISYDSDRLISLMEKQTEENLDILSKYNKEKDLLEQKIRDKRKKLGLKLVYKQHK